MGIVVENLHGAISHVRDVDVTRDGASSEVFVAKGADAVFEAFERGDGAKRPI